MGEEQKTNRAKLENQRPQQPRKARLRLPFDNRQKDFVEWIYDNRIGLCVTIIIYLVASIVFVSAKIVSRKEKSVS